LSYQQEMPAAAATLDTQHFSSEAVFTVLSQPLPQQRHFERGRALAPTARDSWARGGLPPRALQRVRDYIAAHLDGNITNDALAEIAGLSVCHFARAFKQSQGMSPHCYVLHCRVERTQQLLATTDLPLSEVAIASGFSDQSHCARCFRKIVGVTPGAYRWSMR
jgi:transcriptional regulator GlxA family with amidase domain